MKGKDKCRILKQIRQQIADANDIEYITRECTYQGDCRGTCPKCEAELRYLEEQLELRRNRGKKAVIAAVAAGIMLTTTTACDFSSDSSDPAGAPPAEEILESTSSTEELLVMGEVPEPTEEIAVYEGEPAVYELEGDPAPIDEWEETGLVEADIYAEPEIEGDIPENDTDDAACPVPEDIAGGIPVPEESE